MEKVCINCGTPLKKNANFCEICGTKVDDNKCDKEEVSVELLEKDNHIKFDKDKQYIKSFINWKLVAIIIVIIMIIIGIWEKNYFSPEKQVTEVAETFIEDVIDMSVTDPQDVSDGDIEDIAKTFVPAKQDAIKKLFATYRNKKQPSYKEKVKYNIIKTSMHGENAATVYVKFSGDNSILGINNSSVISLIKKDGDWYIDSLK